MSSMLLVGSYIIFLILASRFNDRLKGVETRLVHLGTRIDHLEKQVSAPPASAQAVAAAEPQDSRRPEAADKRIPVELPKPAEQRETPKHPAEPAPPPVTRRENESWNRLWSVNLPAKLGALITLIGFSFLLKLAVDLGWFSFPIWARHLAVGVAGMTFVGAGWRWRDSRPHLARALLGGGFATIQLTVYSAVLVFDVLNPITGFALVVLVSLGTGLLAGILHSRAFAILAIIGGLAAPTLLPDAASHLTPVLGYYAILCGPTLWLAWRERWPDLNLLAFASVFGSSLIWIVTAMWKSKPDVAETEPMILLLFAMFAAVPVVTHIRRGVTEVKFLERILLYATPAAALSLLGLVLAEAVDLAWRSLGLGLFYAGLAMALRRARLVGSELTLNFAALACGFTALAVPLGFDGNTVAVLWALGGTLQIVAGSLRRSRGFTIAGIGLQIAAGFTWWLQDLPGDATTPFVNGSFATAAWIGVLGLFSAWMLDRRSNAGWARTTAWVPFCWGAAWWIGAGLWELDRVLETADKPAAFLAFSFGTALLAWVVEHRRRWNKLDMVAPVSAFGLVGLFVFSAAKLDYPSAHLGWLAWPFAIAIYLRFVIRDEKDQSWRFPIGYALIHALFLAWTAWEIHHHVSRFADGIWPVVSIALLLVVSALFRLTPALTPRWPLGKSRDAYRKWIPAATSVLALGAICLLQLSPGDPLYFPFVPLLNPIDVVSILFLVLLFRLTREEDPQLGPAIVILLGWGFSTLTLIRAVHHWGGVAFHPPALAESMTLQTSLTVYWSLLGVIGMVLGARRSLRTLWKAAAVLMVAVLIKLFLVDLAGVNTAARIISFLGVGGLLLLLGYLAPQPPKTVSRRDETLQEGSG